MATRGFCTRAIYMTFLSSTPARFILSPCTINARVSFFLSLQQHAWICPRITNEGYFLPFHLCTQARFILLALVTRAPPFLAKILRGALLRIGAAEMQLPFLFHEVRTECDLDSSIKGCRGQLNKHHFSFSLLIFPCPSQFF